MVWVNLDILTWDTEFFKDCPNTLDQGCLEHCPQRGNLEQSQRIEPAGIKLQRLWFTVCVHDDPGWTGGFAMEIGV